MGFFRRDSRPSDSSQTYHGRVISMLNQKGGVGKTTMTYHVAHALAEKGHKVLCLDMDPQANLSLLFGIETTQYHIFQLLINSVRELKALHVPVLVTEVVQKVGRVDLLPAGQELSGFELTVAGVNMPRQIILKKFLEKSGLLAQYDYILVDGPPTLGLLVINILCASDGILVPFQPDKFSRKGLEHFHEVVENIEDMGIVTTPKIIGYIPNLVDARRKQTGLEFSDIQQELDEQGNGERIFNPISNKVQLVKAQVQGKSVFDFQSKEFNELQATFLDLAEAITENI